MSAIGKCPWCGCSAEPDCNGTRFWVSCTGCGATGPDNLRGDEEAITAWNRLATPGQGEVPTDLRALAALARLAT